MTVHLEHEIDARGAVYVVLAIDLLPFVHPTSRRTMQEIRGRAIFDDFLERLDVTGTCFERDEEYSALEREGYELGIFRQILFKDNFAPTYRIRKERVAFAEYLTRNVQFRKVFEPVWNRWEFRFRLTRNGIISIVMKLDLPRRRRLIQLSRDVMALHAAFDMAEARHILAGLEATAPPAGSVDRKKADLLRQFIDWVTAHSLLEAEQDYNPIMWPIALMIIRNFIAAVRGHLTYMAGDGFDIRLTDEIERGLGSPLRERYSIFQFDEITQFNRETRKNELIAPRAMLEKQEYAELISSLLEGAVLERRSTERNQAKSYFYPEHNTGWVQHLADSDCSSWKDEFCIIGQRGAAIYSSFPMEREQVVFPSRTICYRDYWRCINRGLEFLIETKVLAQVAERTTYEKLEEALLLLRGNHKRPRPNDLLVLSNETGHAARLMSHLRTITVPQITSHASYAVDKFDLFNRQSGIEKILQHAEANLRDLTSLIQRRNDLNLQQESQRTNEVALGIAMVASLSLAVGVLNFPSYIKDWEEENILDGSFFQQQGYNTLLPVFGQVFVAVLLVACIVVLVVGTYELRQARQRRKPQIL